MISGVAVLVVGVLLAALWVIIEFSKLKHKIYAIALIGFILFAYLSTVFVFKDEDIDYSTPQGIMKAANLYFAFLGSVGKNVFSLTSNAVAMDWTGNITEDRD